MERKRNESGNANVRVGANVCTKRAGKRGEAKWRGEIENGKEEIRNRR